MFRNCLICTDFSDGLYRFINFVPDLTASGVTKIVFLHSVPLWTEGNVPRVDQEKIDAAQARLSQALESVPEGVEVSIEVPSGKPSETIPRIAQEHNSDIILTGTPIRSLLEEKIFGSTSLALAKSTETPILTLRPQLISTYTRDELALRCRNLWRYLLIPYNDGNSAKYLVERLKECTGDRPDNSLQQCLLLWAIEETSSRRGVPTEYRVEEAEKRLAEVKADLENSLNLEVKTQVRVGNPLMQILETAVMEDISAIATSYVTRGALLDWTISSFADEILRSSWFPVLFFSPKQ
ncbi:MAG: universal stress protein [Jaaginema sp. PMC 1079.18]|nr:universal stress protein [Jaaginema sp. PMC 1080.18]MEC4851464.1 universal stress protein [Jaaginema sp. PMC 1079.18]MEC4867013.1 universal stress protein [Jaaginema sp. PMC 1078.18]